MKTRSLSVAFLMVLICSLAASTAHAWDFCFQDPSYSTEYRFDLESAAPGPGLLIRGEAGQAGPGGPPSSPIAGHFDLSTWALSMTIGYRGSNDSRHYVISIPAGFSGATWAVLGADSSYLDLRTATFVPCTDTPRISGPTNLFINAAQGSRDAPPSIATVLRRRVVDIDYTVLGSRSPIASELPNRLVLDLFDDLRVTALLERSASNASGSVVWAGRLEDEENSSVNLVIKRGVVIGNVRRGTKLYQLSYLGAGQHLVQEIDSSSFPPQEPRGAIHNAPRTGLADLEDSSISDDGSHIDAMVAYTSATRAAAGGIVAIENTIDLAVLETNQSYGNSGINQVLNLVHTAEVSYSESGNTSTDLSRFEGLTDGYMDSVHSDRNAYAADVMTLIVENGGGYCGLASMILNPVSTALEDEAFNVTARSCATGNYTFGHELGHIMGARHDWFVDSSNNSPYTYNHGYVSPTDQWRTVMAYSNDCGGCTRVPWWSNPEVSYPGNGELMGVPEGQFHAADNRKTLNNTASTVARFRISDVPDWSYCIADSASPARLEFDIEGGVVVRGQARGPLTPGFPAPIAGNLNLEGPSQLLFSVDYKADEGVRYYQLDLTSFSGHTWAVRDTDKGLYDGPRAVVWTACSAVSIGSGTANLRKRSGFVSDSR